MSYRVAPIFLIRIAGVPFEPIERLSTPGTSAAARELIARQKQCAEARAEAENLLRSGEHLLSDEAFRALRNAIRLRRAPAAVTGIQPPAFRNYTNAATTVTAFESRLQKCLERELDVARTALVESSRRALPPYTIFGTSGFNDRLLIFLAQGIHDNGQLSRRNARARERDRVLLLYLQRVTAKNDTLSEFGPTGWGAVDPVMNALGFTPEPGVAKREAFLERWTAHAVAAAMNADSEILVEFSPRLNPSAWLGRNRIIFVDTGDSVEVDDAEVEVIKHCDGRTPVHSLGVATEIIRALVEKRILRCEMEVPALEPHAFTVLRDDVEKWRPGPLREKWLSILRPIADLPKKFAVAVETKDRRQILEEARSRLQSVGAAPKEGGRFLYAATNPIGEECFRECNFRISDDLINEVAVEAAPWIDFWRDCYAFVASRVSVGLRQLLEKARIKQAAMPLPAFLRLCETAKLPLTGPGLVALAHMAFQEVKAAFREQMKAHADKEEYELTVDDCHFVRKNFQYQKFDEYTYPSADLQIAAESVAAVARGDYRWILAELHPPVAFLQHCMFWACPDKSALAAALHASVCGRPNFYFGFSATDFTAHTTIRFFDAMPKLTNFVAPQRGNPNWRTVRPADAEVYVDSNSGDVCLRKIDNREYLGSFARSWIISLGFHPFQFSAGAHTPRLRCGKVVVQRRAWVVTLDELGKGDFTGVSRDLVLAVERLREQKSWPRFVYIRPTEQALRRSGAEGRDKDTKPVFVDLESYLFLEIFHRWLTKSGELEVTEMLPDPDHLLWKEPDGRRTFELRTLIVPRS